MFVMSILAPQYKGLSKAKWYPTTILIKIVVTHSVIRQFCSVSFLSCTEPRLSRCFFYHSRNAEPSDVHCCNSRPSNRKPTGPQEAQRDHPEYHTPGVRRCPNIPYSSGRWQCLLNKTWPQGLTLEEPDLVPILLCKI